MVSRDGDGTIMNNSDGGGGETMIIIYIDIIYVLAEAEGVANEPMPCSMSDRAERVQRE